MLDNKTSAGTHPAKRSLLEYLFGVRKNSDDDSFRVMLIIMTFGFVALVVISIWAGVVHKFNAFTAVLGLSVIVSLAALVVGGFLGFLFGIPRSLQRNSETPVVQNKAATASGNVSERYYSNNTNLEQISDWLTKIIVGVSLTQLPAIEHNFHILSGNIAAGFKGYIIETYSYPLAGGILVFYSICGFLSVYLWAKIYLLKQLTKMEVDLNKINIQRQVEKVSKLEIARLSTMLTEFNRTKNRILEMENQPQYRDIVTRAKPEPIKYIDDGQKGRWGGSDSSGGYKLEAAFKKNDASADEAFQVILTVRSVDATKPLEGMVYFFLHDSFYKEYIKTAKADNNQASVDFPSFEAFTVGAVCNGGDIKLELDMNTVANCPEDYKYTSPLLTFEDVKKELEELKAEETESNK